MYATAVTAPPALSGGDLAMGARAPARVDSLKLTALRQGEGSRMRRNYGRALGAVAVAATLLSGCSSAKPEPMPTATTVATTRPAACGGIDQQLRDLGVPTKASGWPSPTSTMSPDDARVALRIVVDHPECFSATDVARAEEALREG